MKLINIIKIFIDKRQYLDRSDWVKYLTLSMYQLELLKKKNPEILEVEPNVEFLRFVEEQVHSYLEGSEIAAPIESAVMNCADMLTNGQNIELHAGDYIALQNHFRNFAKA